MAACEKTLHPESQSCHHKGVSKDSVRVYLPWGTWAFHFRNKENPFFFLHKPGDMIGSWNWWGSLCTDQGWVQEDSGSSGDHHCSALSKLFDGKLEMEYQKFQQEVWGSSRERANAIQLYLLTQNSHLLKCSWATKGHHILCLAKDPPQDSQEKNSNVERLRIARNLLLQPFFNRRA